MRGIVKPYHLMVLVCAFAGILSLDGRLHAGQWTISDTGHYYSGPYDLDPIYSGPFTISYAADTAECTNPEGAEGYSGFSSGSACDVEMEISGYKSPGSSSYTGNRSYANQFNCANTYYFSWEGPPSTSPGILLDWSADGNGAAFTAARAMYYWGDASATASAQAYQGGGGQGEDWNYEWWPGGQAYATSSGQVDESTYSVDGSWSAYTSYGVPDEDYGGTATEPYSGPGSDAYSEAYAYWIMDYVSDAYTSEPGISTFRVESNGACATSARVSLSVGTYSSAYTDGYGHGVGEHGFSADAYPAP
jgi:hypothetical protein